MSPLKFSLAVNTLLFIAKVLAAIYTGSAVIIAEAIHSVLDILSAAFALTAFALNKEHLAKYAEAFLLISGSVWAATEIFASSHTVREPLLGIAICGVSLIVYSLTYRNNHSHAHSEAVHANLTHLISDIGSTTFTLAALLTIYLTGWVWLDQIVAALIVGWLIYLALGLLVSDRSRSSAKLEE